MKILWIEDKDDHVKYHVMLLKKLGHDVTVATSGESAIQIILDSIEKNDPYSLVILDIMLPKGIGEKVKPLTKTEKMGLEILYTLTMSKIEIPVICVSAIADEEFRNQIRAEFPSVKAIFKKPLKMTELNAMIEQIFQKHTEFKILK